MSIPTYPAIEKLMRTSEVSILTTVFFLIIISVAYADFEFEWISNETYQGQETATPVEPLEINIVGKDVEVFDGSFALKLHDLYNVYLDNYSWTHEYSYALLNAFEQIPLPYWDTLEISMWYITDVEIDNDILILNNGDTTSVLISLDAFRNANSMLAEIEGVRGKLFSKRLHNAVLRYITDQGSNRQRIDYILDDRYNVSLNPPDYSQLTKHTTGEFRERFTSFKNEEILTIITMLEEFPSGMITTPGLKYIIRRLDGTPHPLYPEAPAVAWPAVGYIEFMESAFTGNSLQHLHRLILHEKAHFLWEHLFDDQLKEDWMLLGEWYQDKDGKWYTLNETEFVSAYAHGENPNEDMAETISYYIVNPDKLRSVSPKKYEFIQNRVMHGDRYISKIREDLTFRVYNLYPDYVYPGKIIKVKIQVTGEPNEDKLTTVQLELHHETPLDLSAGGITRIFSPKGDKYMDQYFTPVAVNGHNISQSNILKAEFTTSKYLPSGYWQPEGIQVWDSNGTPRFTADKKFGWKMYIENPLEDVKSPQYVPNSLKLTSEEVNSPEGSYISVTVTFLAPDDTGIDWFRVGMNDQDSETYSRYADGGLRYRDGSYDQETGLAKIVIKFPHYLQKGLYQVNHIGMMDMGKNDHSVYFTEEEQDENPVSIYIDTKTPDTEPPDLDVNRIKVVANPTNPDNPNGETIVDIDFYVRDNISGYEIGGVNIRDPLGNIQHRWHYPAGRGGMYAGYDTTKYRKYTKQILLPVGSHPGIWGITNIHVADKAGNEKAYDFTEIVRFEVGDAPIYTQYDVNQDGRVDDADLGLVSAALGQSSPVNPRVDVDGSGTVDGNDLLLVIENFDESSDAAPSAIGVKITGLSRDQIQAQIDLLLLKNDNSLAMQQTLKFLHNLLALAVPDRTQLLANYPNPFNPETWIPYQLATDSNVQITIYDTKGIVVRALALGHQAAGYYTGRSRAAYWDGRNALGESVASGVYFYQLRTDETSFTRKMVILK